MFSCSFFIQFHLIIILFFPPCHARKQELVILQDVKTPNFNNNKKKKKKKKKNLAWLPRYPVVFIQFYLILLFALSHQIEEDTNKLENEKSERKKRLLDRHLQELSEFDREMSSHGLEQLSIEDIKKEVLGGTRPLSMIETRQPPNNSSNRNMRGSDSSFSSFTWWGRSSQTPPP